MFLSAKLHLAVGREDLIATEIRATEGYADLDTPWYWTRAAELLAGQKLTRMPRTVGNLEGLLKIRGLGNPLPVSRSRHSTVTFTPRRQLISIT